MVMDFLVDCRDSFFWLPPRGFAPYTPGKIGGLACSDGDVRTSDFQGVPRTLHNINVELQAVKRISCRCKQEYARRTVVDHVFCAKEHLILACSTSSHGTTSVLLRAYAMNVQQAN
jgi:hypothetical protein